MAKDYAKASFKTTRVRKQRSQKIFYSVLAGFILLGISSFFAWYIYQNGMIFNKGKIIHLIAEMKTAIYHSKSQTPINENTKSESLTPEITDVHFDFYTELPNMQVTLPATQSEMNKNVPAINNSVKKDNMPDFNNSAKKDRVSDFNNTLKKDNEPDFNNSVKKDILVDSLKSTATIVNNSSKIEENLPEKNISLETSMNRVASLPNHESKSLHSTVTNDPINTSSTLAKPPIEHYIIQLGAYKNDSTASEIRVSILLAGFDVKVVKTVKHNQIIYRIQQGPYQSLDQAKIAQKKLQAKGFDSVIQKLN
ncbi:MAG: SPOR domain-containing protein [Gammaproteobacteria bacterium]|nr:SPOR domain-containing protein [Gammaproteobacteria bacterium]